jgi:hypothetical protein
MRTPVRTPISDDHGFFRPDDNRSQVDHVGHQDITPGRDKDWIPIRVSR